MSIFVLEFSSEEHAQLREVLQDHAAVTAKAYGALEPKKDQHAIGEARARMVRACIMLAQAEQAVAEEYAQELPHSHAEIQGMKDAGIDPMKELGPRDPIAADPSCVHGRKFSEPCDDCVIPETVASPPAM